MKKLNFCLLQVVLLKKWRKVGLNRSLKYLLALSCAAFIVACSSSEKKTDLSGVRERANQSYDRVDGNFSESGNSKNSVQREVASVEVDKAQVAALKDFACPNSSDLRGEGVSRTSSAALQLAQKQIAAQIQSTVVSTAELKTSQVEDAEGREIIQSSYAVNSKTLTRLENAQDARQVGKVEMDGKVGVVACMSLDDAMKPFVLKYKGLQDSVVLLAETFNAMEHPLKKMDAYKVGREAYTRMVAVRNVLESFEFPVDNFGDESFASMNDNFRQFKSRYAFFYNSSNGGDSEMAVFARLSQKYNVVSGECSGGILLSVDVGDADCKDGSFGVVCTRNLSLTGSSCYGDVYFVQRASVKGTGKYGKSEAEDRLLQNISKGDWFNAWASELEKWNVK